MDSTGAYKRLTLALAAIAAVLMIVSAAERGPWLDDFATFRFADPRVPLRAAWFGLWPTETNPPLFYFIAREGVRFLGASLFARRIVNLLPLCLVMAWFALTAWRYPAQRGLLALYWLIATSSFFFIWDFSSYRSYFFQYAASLVFVGAAAIDDIAPRRSTDWFQVAMVPLLLNLHQVTALFAGATLLVMIARDLHRGLARRALVLLGVAMISGLPLLAFTLMQQHQPNGARALVTWIRPHGVLASLGLIANFMPRALGENWIALAAGLAGLLVCRPRDGGASFLRLIGTSALLGTMLLLAANHFTPLIVDRYFAFLTASVACALAVAIVPLSQRYRAVPWLLAAFAAFYLALSFAQLVRDQRWNSGGDLVASLVAQCPGTRIHAGVLPKNQAEQTGLAYLAAARHLTLLPVEPDQPGTCPVLYWTEYLPPSRLDLARWHGDVVRAANARAGFGLSDQQLTRTRAIRSQNGIVLVVSATGPAS